MEEIYRNAIYEVFAPAPWGTFTLRIGEYSKEVAAMYREWGAECAFLITAHNPHSVIQPPEVNAARNALLRKKLGDHVLPAVGRSPDGAWPEEHGFFGLLADQGPGYVLDFALEFGQDAFIFLSESASPALMMVDHFNRRHRWSKSTEASGQTSEAHIASQQGSPLGSLHHKVRS